MSSRNEVLRSLRAVLPQAKPLPSLEDEPWVEYEDPRAQFQSVLESVGGTCHFVDSMDEADAVVRQLDVFNDSVTRASLVDGVGDTTFDYTGISDPHELETVDFAVLPAHFAVAENAAVWATADNPCDRILHFLSQHVAYVVDLRSGPGLLQTMHAGYEHADPRGQAFSAWVSGPSKTADIEQSLVIGAHGARSLAVVFVG